MDVYYEGTFEYSTTLLPYSTTFKEGKGREVAAHEPNTLIATLLGLIF